MANGGERTSQRHKQGDGKAMARRRGRLQIRLKTRPFATITLSKPAWLDRLDRLIFSASLHRFIELLDGFVVFPQQSDQGFLVITRQLRLLLNCFFESWASWVFISSCICQGVSLGIADLVSGGRYTWHGL